MFSEKSNEIANKLPELLDGSLGIESLSRQLLDETSEYGRVFCSRNAYLRIPERIFSYNQSEVIQ